MFRTAIQRLTSPSSIAAAATAFGAATYAYTLDNPVSASAKAADDSSEMDAIKAWMKEMPELVEKVEEAKAKAEKLSWNPTWKKCLECQEEKDVTEFEKSQKYKSGYTQYCKECLVDLREATHKYKETIKSDENSKTCLVCQKEKPLDKYAKSKKDRTKRESICMLCHRKANREKGL